MSAASPAVVSAPATRFQLYRAIWRWHFYAGLVCIPFMIWLALTGSLYLFHNEIEHTLFAYRTVVAAAPTAPLAPSALVARAVAAVPGSTANSYIDPASPTSSAAATVMNDGRKYLVYLNPYSGHVLDTLPADQEFSYVVKKLHSLDYLGWFTNRLIEAVGGFALILVITGVYLWWPRGAKGGVVTVRGTPRQRTFWRDVHAVTGAFAAIFIFFLAASGMPWTGYWGHALNSWANEAGLGYPPGMWSRVPASTIPTSKVLTRTGWAMEQAPLPRSVAAVTAPIGIDRAVAVARRRGIAAGFEMALPKGPTGVYTAGIFPDDLTRERIIHIDQYSGTPLGDFTFNDDRAIAKAVELGISIHQGHKWGLINQLVMLATCIAVILSSISAVIMWWKRRPRGRLGAPPYPADRRIYRFLWIAAIAAGMAFPITGLAIVAMIAADFLLIRAIRPIRRAFFNAVRFTAERTDEKSYRVVDVKDVIGIRENRHQGEGKAFFRPPENDYNNRRLAC